MTRSSEGGAGQAERVHAHGAGLHRLAAMLTADTSEATWLTARALVQGSRRAAADPAGDSSEGHRLRAVLVRRYLRSAPRRAEGLSTPEEDAGDVLRRLSPRARAAAALRLVEGWSAPETASALGVSPRRVEAMVPPTPGLDLALTCLADQHALSGSDLDAALRQATQDGPAPAARDRRRRWSWVAAAAVPLALLVGYAVDHRDGRGAVADDGPGPQETAQAQDLTEAGWTLGKDGEPPRTAMGLHLRDTVTLEGGRRTGTVRLPGRGDLGHAAFGVLWCQMPPAKDDHLRVPVGTLTVGDTSIDLPCAGRDGTPPVSRVVALPPRGEGTLEVTGDMPGDGVATLAIYTEMDEFSMPMGRGSRTDAPPVGDDDVALDVHGAQLSLYQTRRLVQAVSVGHDSTIRAWAGRTGGMTISVDGVPATDDGDIAAMMADIAAWEAQPDAVADDLLPPPRGPADWSTQQADVRDGWWSVHAPGATRTFALPAAVRPPPGERRTVVLEVFAESVEEHLQVAVTDAEPAEVDTTPLPALADPDVPELLLGHRLVGQWRLPSDGHLRRLVPGPSHPGGAGLSQDVVLVGVREGGPERWFPWGQGVAQREDHVTSVWLHESLDTALQELWQRWTEPLPGGPGPVSVAASAQPGRPPTMLLAYEPVPYEEYDFAAADAPPLDEGRPPWHASTAGYALQAVIGPEDLENGRVTVPVDDGTAVAARITTEGKGRIRFLVNRQPADALWASDGWWSSWTAQPVTSEVEVSYAGYPRRDVELTLVVEDYGDFSVEVLTG